MNSTKFHANFILEKLESDPVAVEFQWSIFFSALYSYRCDTVLRPFPSSFLQRTNGEKNFAKIKDIAVKLGCLRSLKNRQYLSEEQVTLLYWVLDTKNFYLKSHSQNKFKEIKEKTGQIVPTPVPNYVIEVFYSPNVEARFEAIRGNKSIFYAYHGSRLDNFYSILHNGLHNHLNKNSVFGEGTYLSSELSVCLAYSPAGEACCFNSVLGDQLSCIAVCEIINHPDVKCQTKVNKNEVRDLKWLAVSFSPDLPEKYYIVQNDELIRVKYILVYTKKAKTSTRPIQSWISKHRFVVIMIIYFGILIVIGLMNSRSFNQFHRKYLSWQ